MSESPTYIHVGAEPTLDHIARILEASGHREPPSDPGKAATFAAPSLNEVYVVSHVCLSMAGRSRIRAELRALGLPERVAAHLGWATSAPAPTKEVPASPKSLELKEDKPEPEKPKSRRRRRPDK